MTDRTRTRVSLATLAALAAGGVAVTVPAPVAAAADEAVDALRTEIEALQAKLEAIEARKAAEAEKAETESDAFERVLADADKRSAPGPVSFLQADADDPDPFTGGHNGKFLLQSEDGDFSLNPNFQIQIRHVANFAPIEEDTEDDDSDGDPDLFEDVDFGWEIRRAKIGFKGNAFSPDLTYDLKFAFGRNDGNADLENAFVDYTPEPGIFGNDALGFRIGQYKDPTFFAESTSSSKQMAADRSLVNETLGGGITDFVQGAGLLYKGENVTGLFAYVDGFGSANTNFEDAQSDFEAGLSARIDVVVAGDDDAFEDFTALETEEDSARIGFGGFVTFADDGEDFQYRVLHTADFSYETAGGLSVFAAYYGDFFDNGDFELDDGLGNTTTEADDGYNVGAELQVAQLLGESGYEVFGRYDFIFFEDEIEVDGETGGEDFYHEVVAGVNKYWESHKVKATVDVAWLINGNPGSNSGIGYRDDGAQDEGQVAIRGQFQLLL